MAGRGWRPGARAFRTGVGGLAGSCGEGFAGTDSVVTEVLEQEGTKPWFQPIFEPGSAEIESGLFALQAALGAGIVGFALGNLRGRAKSREEAAAAGPAPVKPSGDAPVPATE